MKYTKRCPLAGPRSWSTSTFASGRQVGYIRPLLLRPIILLVGRQLSCLWSHDPLVVRHLVVLIMTEEGQIWRQLNAPDLEPLLKSRTVADLLTP